MAKSTGQEVLTWITTETLDWACNPPLLVVFWTLTKSHAKSHVKDGPLRRKDVAIWKGGVGSNFVGPGSRFARLRGADPWRHGRGRICLWPMDSDDRKCPSIVVNRCISLRQKLHPHGGMAARVWNYRKPSTSTSETLRPGYKILHFWWFPGLSQNLRNPVS